MLHSCCSKWLAGTVDHCFSLVHRSGNRTDAVCRYLILAMVKLIGLSRLGKLQQAAAVMTFFFSVVVCFDRCSTIVMPAVWLQ